MRRRYRVWGATLAAFATVLTISVLPITGGGGGAGATTANVWVVHTGGTCSARQSTAATLAAIPSSAKCTSWPAAYQLATNGDTVGVETGSSYGTQSFTSCNTGLTGSNHLVRNGTEVTFTPDSGTVTVALQGFTNCRYDLTFTNVVDCPDTGVASAHDLHFVGIDCVGGEMFMGAGGSYISIENSDFGPYNIPCGGSAKLLALWGVNTVLIAGSTFHDMSAVEGCTPGTHPDGIESCGTECGNPAVHDITIRGNRFWNNACDSGRFQSNTEYNYLIENNMYGPAVTFEGGCSQSIAFIAHDSIVRYNTFGAAVDSSHSTNKDDGTNDKWIGNIWTIGQSGGTAWTCPPTATGLETKYNVGLTGSPTTCGTSQPNTVVSSMTGWFTDTSTGNFHLTSCALGANDAGDPAGFPTIDFDSGARSNPPDAGADECGSP